MAFNRAMNTEHPDKKLIQSLGGPAKVALKIGLDPSAGGVQRVHNWMTRGIPAAVRLSNLKLFGNTAEKPAKKKAA